MGLGYLLGCIYNMDESRFAVGTSQFLRSLVNIREKSIWKLVNSRQEWNTAIEYISAAGVANPPLVLFKAKHTNKAWIPQDKLPNWGLSRSNSGWTSHRYACEWLTTVFEPLTKPDDPAPHNF
jgi:hypothetical protein